MHVQHESLSMLLRWSESEHAHKRCGIALDAVTLSGYLEGMGRIVSQSHMIISALDHCYSVLGCTGSNSCGNPPTHYPAPPRVPEPNTPLPGPSSATRNSPSSSSSVYAQRYPASRPTRRPLIPCVPSTIPCGIPSSNTGPPTEKRRSTSGKDPIEAEDELQDFLEGLPKDALSANEENLRAALVDAWKQHWATKWKTILSFSQIQQYESVRTAKLRLFPPGIGTSENDAIKRWIGVRIPDEFTLSKKNGQLVMAWKESDEDRERRIQEGLEQRKKESDEFLDSLDEHELTAEEYCLHDALLEAHRKQNDAKLHGSDHVLLSHICRDENVRKAKSALLPEAVSVRQWIEARIGEELILSETDYSQLVVAIASENRG